MYINIGPKMFNFPSNLHFVLVLLFSQKLGLTSNALELAVEPRILFLKTTCPLQRTMTPDDGGIIMAPVDLPAY